MDSRKWQPGAPTLELIEGKLEDHDVEFLDEKVIYWLTDVHYYLYDWLTGPVAPPSH